MTRPGRSVPLFFGGERMPLLADKTVLLSCLFCNNETDEEAEVTTLLSGVSVHAKTIASANADGLSAASVMQIRIFADTARRPVQRPQKRALSLTTRSSPLHSGPRRKARLPPRRGRYALATTSPTRAPS